MNLVIDAGNSTVKLFVFSGNTLKEKTQTALSAVNKTVRQLVNTYPIKRSIFSNVGSTSPENFLDGEGIPFIALHAGTPLPFRINYQTPYTLGRDRIAAVAGAFTLFPHTHVLVIDAGTAITYDFIDDEAVYQGGTISPGLHMRFRSLHEFTHALPLVEPARIMPEKGDSTENAIKKGVQQGILFEMESYIKKFMKQYGDLRVILTGGDTLYFADKLKKFIFAESNLVAIGLNTILNHNANA